MHKLKKRIKESVPLSVCQNMHLVQLLIMSHLEYCDVMFHQPPADGPLSIINLSANMEKLESVQTQAAYAVSGAWKGTSTKKIYRELGWEWLSQRHWYRRMSKFHNILFKTSPKYLTDLLRFRTLGRRDTDPLCPILAHTEKVQMSFFPSCTFSWNKVINHDLRVIDDVAKNHIFEFT